MTVNVSNKIRINYDDEPVPCRMIESIDDILELAKEDHDSKEVKSLTLILKDDNLNEFTINLINAGYLPEVKNQAGRITLVMIKIKNLIMIVRTQTVSS